MYLLLDTNILIPLAESGPAALHSSFRNVILDPSVVLFASVASLWEIAIKTRTGRLKISPPLESLPDLLADIRIALLTIDHRHVLTSVEPQPPTRDPFDRLLLAQCAVETMRLVTTDRALAAHPLAWLP